MSLYGASYVCYQVPKHLFRARAYQICGSQHGLVRLPGFPQNRTWVRESHCDEYQLKLQTADGTTGGTPR
jgi:hypothetical protein